jgi:hypothetical protein
MPWNIDTLSFLISCTPKEPLFIVSILKHLSKMVGQDINIVTYLIMFEPYSFLLLVRNVFGADRGVGVALTVVHTINHLPSLVSKTSLILNGYIVM